VSFFDTIIEPPVGGSINPKGRPQRHSSEASGPVYTVADYSSDEELQDILMNCDNRLIRDHASRLITLRKTMPPKAPLDLSSEDVSDDESIEGD
jgi:hypothetical protein